MAACGATCGITKSRERELRLAWATAERVYPGLVWRSLDPGARAVSFDALASLAATLEDLLPVRVRVRLGESGGCDALYVVAGLHANPLCDIADGLSVGPPDFDGGHLYRETYVRVAISPHGRFAALQEIVMSASIDDGGYAIVEEPRAGVVDRRLQIIIRGLQGALRKAKLLVLDMAALVSRIEGAASADLEAHFLDNPTLWSLLFEGPSPMTLRTSWIPGDKFGGGPVVATARPTPP